MYFLDPHNLGIRCRLNGETVQDSNTNQLVHKTEGLVSYISQYVTIRYTVYPCILQYTLVYFICILYCRFVTLKPGDVVLTGTPPGVGCFRKPPLWLKV